MKLEDAEEHGTLFGVYRRRRRLSGKAGAGDSCRWFCRKQLEPATRAVYSGEVPTKTLSYYYSEFCFLPRVCVLCVRVFVCVSVCFCFVLFGRCLLQQCSAEEGFIGLQ